MDRTAKVLVIDDDKDVVALLERILRREFRDRIDLTAMSDSVVARQWIHENRPEVVVTDLDMPNVDGFELLRDAKRWNPNVRIVVFSARAEEHADYLIRKIEVADCVPKSGGFARLLAGVKNALEGLPEQQPEVAEPRSANEPLQDWTLAQALAD